VGFSTKKKRGRPKVQRTPHDYGNQRVQVRSDLFRAFRGDASKGFEMSCAGRLMLVGAFDGLEYDPEVYLSALLDYQNADWGEYHGGPKIAAYERSDRSHDSRWDDPRGEWFAITDDRLRSAGHAARSAVHSVSVDRHWFPDEDAGWCARIINSRFLDKKLPVSGELACDSDYAMLDLLRHGVAALVGVQQKRAA
jgi:hypothetical protein